MLVRIPYLFPDSGTSYAVLVGSSGGGWQARAARELEKSFDFVCLTDSLPGIRLEVAAGAISELLPSAAAVAVWLDTHPCLYSVELGRVLERQPGSLACGVAQDSGWLTGGEFKFCASSRGVTVWDTLGGMIAAAKNIGRMERDK